MYYFLLFAHENDPNIVPSRRGFLTDGTDFDDNTDERYLDASVLRRKIEGKYDSRSTLYPNNARIRHIAYLN